LKHFEIVGRKLPSERDPKPTLYKMQIFAPNTMVAKSRFWYFLSQLKKMKKSTGQVVSVEQVRMATYPRTRTSRLHHGPRLSQRLCPSLWFASGSGEAQRRHPHLRHLVLIFTRCFFC
jgi:hypothetical protein